MFLLNAYFFKLNVFPYPLGQLHTGHSQSLEFIIEQETNCDNGLVTTVVGKKQQQQKKPIFHINIEKNKNKTKD